MMRSYHFGERTSSMFCDKKDCVHLSVELAMDFTYHIHTLDALSDSHHVVYIFMAAN